MAGYLVIDRTVFSDAPWRAKPLTVALANYLIFEAAHTAHERIVPGGMLKVKKGQAIIGRKKVCVETGLSEQEFRTALTHLKMCKFSTSESTNHYTIVTICNYDKITSVASNNQPANQPTSNQPATNQQPTSNHIINNVNKGSNVNKGISLSDEKAIGLADCLAEIIRTKKNINITKGKTTIWAKSFAILQEKDGVTFERINIALQWYCENIGGEFVPVIESGKSFREKFLKLEAAIARTGNIAPCKSRADEIYEKLRGQNESRNA